MPNLKTFGDLPNFCMIESGLLSSPANYFSFTNLQNVLSIYCPSWFGPILTFIQSISYQNRDAGRPMWRCSMRGVLGQKTAYRLRAPDSPLRTRNRDPRRPMDP